MPAHSPDGAWRRAWIVVLLKSQHADRPSASVADWTFGGEEGTVRPFMWEFFKEFLLFLRQEKKWWLAPLVIVLLLLGAFIVFGSSSILAPLMYPFM